MPAGEHLTYPWSKDALVYVLAKSLDAGHGVYVGVSAGREMYGPPEQSALVLGPPRSGKTTCIVVPNVLGACGPVVSASTKRDVLDATYAARRRADRCELFDPSGETVPPAGVELVGWSPVPASRSYDRAVHVAEAMVEVVRGGVAGREDRHWNERAGALLATLYHAAAIDGAKMRDVVSWVDRRDPAAAQAILARGDAVRPCEVITGITRTDVRELSGIWSTASGVLSAYRTEAALRSSEHPPFDAASFVSAGSRRTLYICASGRQQWHAAPLVAGLITEIRDAAYRQARGRVAGSPAPAPVLAVLDEMANIAPLRDLPALVSEGGSQGFVVLGCLQDLSQARARWGSEADGFFSLFGTKVILRGIGDVHTLESVSKLCGERQVPVQSRTTGSLLSAMLGRGRASTTVSTRTERQVPLETIATGMPGMAFVMDSVGVRGFVGLTPHHLASPWRDIPMQQERAWIFARGRDVAIERAHGRGHGRDLGRDLGRGIG